MRIALCFFGQPRWLENSYTYESLQHHILSKYDNIDVYMHMWITPSEENVGTYFNGGNWQPVEGKGVELINAKQILLEKYSPKKYKFEKQKQFESVPGIEEIYLYQKENELAVLSQIYSINQSINLIQNPNLYDFIILTRTDIYYNNFPSLHTIKDEGLYLTNRYCGFPNAVIIGTPTYVRYLILKDTLSERFKHMSMFTPEELLRSIYYSHTNVSPKYTSIDVGIVRSSTLDGLQF